MTHEYATPFVLWLGSLLPRLLTTPNGSQRLPTAPYDYNHTLLLFSSSMTPTDFRLLPSRELTPQPYSQDKSGIKKVLLGFRNFVCLSESKRNFREIPEKLNSESKFLYLIADKFK